MTNLENQLTNQLTLGTC